MLIKSYILIGRETVVGDEVLHYVALDYIMELDINNSKPSRTFRMCTFQKRPQLEKPEKDES